MNRVGLSIGYIKIKCFQALVWWLKILKLRGKYIEINHFNRDIQSDSIKNSQIEYEYTIYGQE